MKLPVCFESKSTATVFRRLLDELGYQYKRTNVSRSYSGVAIVIAIERVAMVYRYEINEIETRVDIWEERPNSGNVTYIETRGGEAEIIRNILEKFSQNFCLYVYHIVCNNS